MNLIAHVQKVFSVPEDAAARTRKLSSLRKAVVVVLNVALVLAVTGLLALNERTAVNYGLSAAVLVSWFVLGCFKK